MSRGRWTAVALLVVGVATAAAYLVLRDSDSLTLGVLTKPVPIFCMAVWVVLRCRGARRGLFLGGLLLSAAGDIVLLGSSSGAFIGGLVCFLFAHLVYIGAFVHDQRRLRPLRALPFLGFTGVVFAVLFGGLGEMLIPVAAYCLAIALMGWRAAARVGTPGPASAVAWIGVAGASFFMASDSLIALNKFHQPIPHEGIAIMVTYYLGQLGITLSASGWEGGER